MLRVTCTISIIAMFALVGCASPTPATPVVVAPISVTNSQPTAVSAGSSAAAGMANPASVNCEQQGGKVDIRKDPKGGEVGYCVFPDKSECEEWALLRGECKPGAKAATTSLVDPFAYCSAVGTVDTPDARYTGPKIPDAIVRGLMKAMGMSADAPVDQFAKLTTWRCMNNQVYACNVGANIPCSEKADVNKTPTAAMNDFCKANPSSSAIPAVVTGRATVYDWKCTSGKPQINEQLSQADARGYLAEFWYQVAK